MKLWLRKREVSSILARSSDYLGQWKQGGEQHGWNTVQEDGRGALKGAYRKRTQHLVADASWSALSPRLLQDFSQRLISTFQKRQIMTNENRGGSSSVCWAWCCLVCGQFKMNLGVFFDKIQVTIKESKSIKVARTVCWLVFISK